MIVRLGVVWFRGLGVKAWEFGRLEVGGFEVQGLRA